MMQGWLFGHEAPHIDLSAPGRLERIDLGEGAWLELARGYLSGHARLFEELLAGVPWREEDRKMYDRVVAVPRMFAMLETLPPIVEEMRRALSLQYETEFTRVSAALYRGGQDSVAWHGDYVARELPGDTLVATVSLGAPRKFLVRQKGGGRSRSWALGCGDLLVMGGSCQRTQQHSVPKTVHAEPRIALMFRPSWE